MIQQVGQFIFKAQPQLVPLILFCASVASHEPDYNLVSLDREFNLFCAYPGTPTPITVSHYFIPLAVSEEAVLMPCLDHQQSQSSADLTDEAGLQLKSANLESLQHVSSSLPQLDQQPIPMFTLPVMSQQPEIDTTLTNDLDGTPQTDFTLPVNGQPDSELDLSAVPLAEEQSDDGIAAANTSKEEPDLPEEVPLTCPP